jgi:hypothetical protein
MFAYVDADLQLVTLDFSQSNFRFLETPRIVAQISFQAYL